MRRATREDGQALIEAALTIPLLLLLAIGILEFGRAYQTWQILTHAAREGARMAVVPYANSADAATRVREYMTLGRLPKAQSAAVTVDRSASITVGTGTVSATQVTIVYPFDFIVLKPVARLIPGATTLGNSLAMQATAIMRNEM